MQVERDVHKKKVLLAVCDYALKYKINIEFVDLRKEDIVKICFATDKAVYWCLKAVENGDKSCCSFIGDALLLGRYTLEKDHNKCVKLLVYEIENGCDDFKDVVKRIYNYGKITKKTKEFLDEKELVWKD